jgi:PAS domain-containing protein
MQLDMAKAPPTKRHGSTPGIQDNSNVLLEQAVNENERQNRAVIENISQVFVMYNNTRRVVIWNKQYEGIFQHQKGFLHTSLSNGDIIRYLITHGDYGGKNVKMLLQERIKIAWGRKAVQYEINIFGNKTCKVVAPLTDDGGGVTTYAVITERKNADEAIKGSEARLRDYAEVASDWYWEQNSDLRFTSKFDSDTSISIA